MTREGDSLVVVDDRGVRFLEGQPDEPFMTRADDGGRIVEACFSARVRSAILYPSNLTPAFFDLSSGEAGAILQKLRNYGVHLAVVCPEGSVTLSSRFGELLAEERQGPWFRVFETRDGAREWVAGIEQARGPDEH